MPIALALAAALASTDAAPRESQRPDGSVLHWSIDRRGDDRPRGILVLAQGSGCLPAEKSPALQAAKALLPDFAVVTVEKYGVTPQDAPADPFNGCSPTFYANHTISQRAADYAQVVGELRGQPWFDGRVVLFGGSEGGAAVSQAAEAVKPHAVVVYSSGIGAPLRDMFKQVVPPAVAATADAEFAKARAEPTSATVWGGSSYRWWADAMDRVYVRDLLKTGTPVLLVQGGRDQSAPMSAGRASRDAYAAAGRTELTYLEYPAYDHFMKDAEGVSHQTTVYEAITVWLQKTLSTRQVATDSPTPSRP